MHDLVIRGGTVVDGSGGAPRRADVAVDDGRITEVGRLDGTSAREEIDADGAIVTPGFVDVHAHYDGQATWDDHLTPSSWHGVTTVVMGNCGVGFAPVHPHDHERLIGLMEGVEDIPGAVLHEGVTWGWESFSEYLDVLEARHRDVDVCALVPHGPVRLHVMGERGAAREAATPGEIDEMGRIVAEAVAAGGFGFSTSRTLNHRTNTGEMTPTIGAARDELVGICAAMRATNGRGVFEVVSDVDDLDAELGLFEEIAAAGTQTFVSLNQNKMDGGWRRVLDRIEAASTRGVPISAQVAVRGIGLLLGLETTLHPFLFNPEWRPLTFVPLGEKVAALRDPSFRRRLIEAHDASEAHRFGDPGQLFRLDDPPDYEPAPEASLGAIAEREGRHVLDVVCDLLLADDGAGLVYYPIFNYDAGDLEDQRSMLQHPDTIIGLADGGAHVGTICDASFPTTMLTHWVRDRTRGPRLELEWAVKAQTADTAAAYGLADRGRIAPGLRGDLNVIDLDRLQARRPEIARDLPAGGKRLVQRAEGYVATIVAGVTTLRDDELTGALPGRLVRSSATLGA